MVALFEIFIDDRTMALVSNQLITEMTTRDIFWGVKAVGA